MTLGDGWVERERGARREENQSKQLTSENGHSIREDPSLKNGLCKLKSPRKKWRRVLLNLVVSMRPLRHLVRIHGPLIFFDLSSFVCWVTGQLRFSFALAFPPPVTQILPIPLLPPPPPQFPPKKTPTRSIPFNRWAGELPRTRGHWRLCRCVEGACEEVDRVWDVELVGEEEQQE